MSAPRCTARQWGKPVEALQVTVQVAMVVGQVMLQSALVPRCVNEHWVGECGPLQGSGDLSGRKDGAGFLKLRSLAGRLGDLGLRHTDSRLSSGCGQQVGRFLHLESRKQQRYGLGWHSEQTEEPRVWTDPRCPHWAQLEGWT